jgi:HTH-type transcriptional regulator/antitoxin HigA
MGRKSFGRPAFCLILFPATRWLSPSKALIQLSLRYKTDDHLWFSFFHEAGHILKHGKRDVFRKGTTFLMDETKEEEANTFAADFLIPRREYLNFTSKNTLSKVNIKKFASQIKISPGIVVGRLQHDKLLPMSHCNDLKVRFELVRK